MLYILILMISVVIIMYIVRSVLPGNYREKLFREASRRAHHRAQRASFHEYTSKPISSNNLSVVVAFSADQHDEGAHTLGDLLGPAASQGSSVVPTPSSGDPPPCVVQVQWEAGDAVTVLPGAVEDLSDVSSSRPSGAEGFLDRPTAEIELSRIVKPVQEMCEGDKKPDAKAQGAAPKEEEDEAEVHKGGEQFIVFKILMNYLQVG